MPVVLGWKQRGRNKADSFYLLLMISYCIWLIIFSILYFSDAFVRPLSASVRTVFSIFRMTITIAVVLLYSILAGELAGRGSSGRYKYLVFIAPAVYSVLLFPVLLKSSVFFAGLVTFLFYFYMGGISACIFYIFKKHKKTQRNFVWFIRLMLIYNLAGLLLVILPLQNISLNCAMVLSVLPRAAFCLAWGILELVYFILREFKKEREGAVLIHSVFADDFKITAREQDVISCILTGLSNRQTAAKLFISEKTVETHIYSVYRKCNVKNKIELLNLISNHC